MVWGNKPAISGSPVASVGAVTVGTWVEVDLTSAITGNGTYSFEATTTSTNTAAFETSQGTHPPQVVVDRRGFAPGPSGGVLIAARDSTC